MRHKRAIAVTTFLAALFGSLVWVIGSLGDNPPLFLLWNLLFIVWALAIRWWLVTGGLIGLLGAVLTPVLDSDNLDRIVIGIMCGVGIACAIDYLRRPDPALPPPIEPQSPLSASAAQPSSRDMR